MTKIVRCLSLFTVAAVLQACGGGSGPATQPNGTAPVITTQPAAVTVASGAPATFSVAATGTPTPAYQWKRNGADIGGATGSTYALPAAAPADNGAVFSVTATNSIGVATSNNAVLTVNYAPTITTQPAAQTVTAGQPASFSVAASGNPLPTYQWKRNGADIAGAVASSYSIPTTNVGDNGASFTVTATNSIGTVTSTAAVLTVNAGAGTSVAPTITTQPASLTRVDGASATFAVVATGTPAPTYQWKANNIDIPGATSANLTFNAALANSGTAYTVVVTNAAGAVTSSAATLTVTPLATAITAQPAPQSVVDGQPASFTVAVTGSAPLTYQWRRNGTNIAGATNQTYNIATAVPGNNGELYSVLVAGPGGSVTSNNALLTVSLVSPTIDTQPVSQTVVQGSTATFSVAVSGSAPLFFQWRKDGVNIPAATGPTYTTGAQTPWPADNGSVYTVIVSNDGTVDGAGTDVTSAGATLTVTQTVTGPSITGQPASANVLEGSAASFTVTAAGTAPSYQWQKQPVAGTFADIGGATSATYSIGSAMFADNGAQYRVVVTNAQGTVTSAAATLNVTRQAMSIFAGYPGAQGNVNGTGTSARFSFPSGVAFDPTTNDAIIADFGNQTIRRITPAGVVTTVAGTPKIQGYVNATGSAARFNNPRGVAVSASGEIFVADQGNGSIRKVDINGAVTTLAGNSDSDYADGTAPNARFNAPNGLAISGSTTTMYVADFNNHRIRKVDTATGFTSTIAGTGVPGLADGSLAASQFQGPAGITVDPGVDPTSDADDIIYVADMQNSRLRKLDIGGNAVTTIGAGFGAADGDAATARFVAPRDVAWSSVGPSLYVADTESHTLRLIDLSRPANDPAYVTTIAGSAGVVGAAGGVGTAARFNLPYSIAVNTAGTELRVANYGSDTVYSVTVGPPLSTNNLYAGSPDARGSTNDPVGTNARFSFPRGITTGLTGPAAGVTFVADSFNNSIRRIAPDGATTLYAGDPSSSGGNIDGTALGQAKFNDPRGVAVDASGTVYVADRSSNAVRRISVGGVVTTIANSASLIPIDVPDAVLAAPSGTVYVANRGRNNVVAIDTANGNAVSLIAGSIAGTAGYADGAAASARFVGPSGLALQGSILYVSDGARIRAIDLVSATVSTVAGDGTNGYADNANGLLAKFENPGSLVVDNTGNYLYITDYSNSSIRRMALAGQHEVTTPIGVPGDVGVRTGAIADARLNSPIGISIRPTGPGTQLIVSDALEHVILSIVLP